MKDKSAHIVALIFVGCLSFFFALAAVKTVYAQGSVTVSPSIIDEKARARDIIEREITLVNGTEAKVELYAVVNDIRKEGGKQDSADPAYLDKASSLARWIEINRGAIELLPGETKVLPLKIAVNLAALADSYYAQIAFAGGSNRTEAENKAAALNQPTVAINITVEANVIERAEIESFVVSKTVNTDKQAEFLLRIKNIGNREVAPAGSIIIHNNRGQEVGLLEVNRGGMKITPGESSDFNQSWEASGRIGRFKASLEVDYGDKEARNLQDTIYFWVLPLWSLLLSGVAVIILITGLLFLSLRLRHHEKKHLQNEEQARKLVIDLKNKNKTN